MYHGVEFKKTIKFKGMVFCVTIAALFFLSGCADLQRNPIPVDKMHLATIEGMEGVRDFGDEYSEVFQRDMEYSLVQEKDNFTDPKAGGKKYHALALSGGGANGAFGAGFLIGWTAHGTRPDFKLVTGISTGALIAPFAFLGYEFDPELEDLYTSTSTKTLIRFRGLLGVLANDSLADPAPMIARMEELVDEEFLKRIAQEHNRGKRLLIGTSYLDAGRFVVWNMGAIASSGHPNALKLFHKVILASSSIPGVFPPVLIDVSVDGKTYDEMHVDGGVQAQLFLLDSMINRSEGAIAREVAEHTEVEVYIIRNGKLAPEPGPVRRNLLDILSRASADLMKTAVRDSLYRVRSYTELTGVGFNYIGISEDFQFRKTDEPIDQTEMIRIFNSGYQESVNGPKWIERLPGL